MGNCNSSDELFDQNKINIQQMLKDYPDLKTGYTMEIGCGLAGTVGNSVECPQGFTSLGQGGGCKYCSDRPGIAGKWAGVGYGRNGAIIDGARLKCQLSQYLGDPKDCCLTKKSDKGYCDPSYNCNEIIQKWCEEGDNIKTDFCREYIKTNKS